MKSSLSTRPATSRLAQARDSFDSDEAKTIVSRLVPLHETRERDFDIQFWQAQGPAAIIAAAREIVES